MSPAAPSLPLHRPARVWPRRPEPSPVILAPVPPAPAAATSGLLPVLLSGLGLVSMGAFAVLARSLTYLAVAGGMAVMTVAGGLAAQRMVRGQRRARDRGVQERYQAHLAGAEAEAASAAAVQRAGATGVFPDPEALRGCLSPAGGLWERRPSDPDFGLVRLGLGSVPALRPVRLGSDPDPREEPDAALARAADSLVARTAVLAGAPVTIPLTRFGCVAVVGPSEACRDLLRSWLAGLAVFHSPCDLRFSRPVSSDDAEWDWVSWLPHAEERAGPGGHLIAVLDVDAAGSGSAGPAGVAPAGSGSAEPGRPAGMGGSVGWPAAPGPVGGVTTIVLVRSAAFVPGVCEATVELTGPGLASYLESGPTGRVETYVRHDGMTLGSARRLAQRLGPLQPAEERGSLVSGTSPRLADLLLAPGGDAEGPARIEMGDLDDGTHPRLLEAVIGRDSEGRRLTLSLAEAAVGGMGPHGIVVGSTGSGKSELLRSLTLSLAVGHSPALLNLLLIDFKGGATFAGMADLPHVAGMVTNLAEDAGLIDRVGDALRGEIERRQEALRREGNAESIRSLHARGGGAALPYLVVIVDEFGELLAARPEFIETFATIGSVGRSLGMHLLVASQRLDESKIRRLDPHLRYRIALRTNTSLESRSVLDSPAAFELPPTPGIGYLRVDDALVPFRAAWAGDVLGSLVAGAAGAVGAAEESAERPARRVWLDPLPDHIGLGELSAPTLHGPAGECHDARRIRESVLGLVDIPARQLQRPLVFDWSGAQGNLAVVGAPRTGKSTILQTLVASVTAGRTPDEVHVYAVDLGGGGLVDLSGLPHVGAVTGRGEVEETSRLIREVQAMIDDRAEEVSPAPADVFLLIDNVSLLHQMQPELDAALAGIANAGLRHRVHVVVTANRWFDIRPSLLDAIGTRLELRLGEPSESMVGRHRSEEVPTDRPGRGLTREGHLFQAAVPLPVMGSHDQSTSGFHDWPAFVTSALAAARGKRAPAVSRLPATVHRREVDGLAERAGSPACTPGRFVLGVSEFRGRPVELDLSAPGAHLLIYGDAGSGRTSVLAAAALHLAGARSRRVLHLVDPSRRLAGLASSLRPQSHVVTAGAANRLAVELAASLVLRLPADDAVFNETSRPGWEGPEHFLVIDDYERLAQGGTGPFGPLVELMSSAADIGLHVLLARRVGGATRTAFEPFMQRLREEGPNVLVLSGSPEEGPLAAGITPKPLPPGRGMFATAGARPVLLQCCRPEESPVVPPSTSTRPPTRRALVR